MAYSGDFVHDEIEGCGRYVYANGDMYEGRFVAGKRHGYGMYHYKVGTRVGLGGHGSGVGGHFRASWYKVRNRPHLLHAGVSPVL